MLESLVIIAHDYLSRDYFLHVGIILHVSLTSLKPNTRKENESSVGNDETIGTDFLTWVSNVSRRTN